MMKSCCHQHVRHVKTKDVAQRGSLASAQPVCTACMARLIAVHDRACCRPAGGIALYAVHAVDWRDGSPGGSGMSRFGLRQGRPGRHHSHPYAALSSHPRLLGPGFSFQSKPPLILSLGFPFQFNVIGVEGDPVRHGVRSARSARPAPFFCCRTES